MLGWSQSAVARAESGQRDSLYDLCRLFEVVDALDMPREALMFGGGLVNLAVAAGLSQVQVPVKIVSAAHIRYFNASVEKLYTKDQSVGGGALARGGLRLYHRVRKMLDEADYGEAVGRQLMTVAGELAVCVGWLAYDASDHALSRALYSQARLLADQSGDHGLAIRAMKKMALHSVNLRRKSGFRVSAREAVRLSRRAPELARHDPSPQLHALLAAREAIA
jgi:hypothetical protein